VAESITVTSRSFGPGGAILVDATCDGGDVSPEVTWSSPPDGTKALVVTLDDLDTQGADGTRWLLVDVKPDVRRLKPGVEPAEVAAQLGRNGSGQPGYRGPCPPHRLGHHYSLRVFALDRALELPAPPDREAVNTAMDGHVLGSGELVGTASR
jgi:Raf kinase inhibitor-like YbhB/YbcL family protein